MTLKSSRRWIAVAGLLAVCGYMAYRLWAPFGDLDGESTQLVQLLHLRPGNIVAEVGAGDGSLSEVLLRKMGPGAKVITTELDSKKLGTLREKASHEPQGIWTVIQGNERVSRLPDGCCDAIVMRRVYHHVTQPREMDRSLVAALKPGGRIAVIDFKRNPVLSWISPVKNVPANRQGHGIAPDAVLAELRSAGFILEAFLAQWPGRSYCLVMRRADQDIAIEARNSH